jgi:cell fate regulator YaaT (PSP1 superfamily)
MMQWGNPDMSLIKYNLERRRKEDGIHESQIELNRKFVSSFERLSERNIKPTVTHNHFNIIINVAPNTTNEKITSLVEKLTTIVERVN